MSLINQMLQELEQRKAADAPTMLHATNIHAVNPAKPNRRVLSILVLSAVFVGAYGLSKMQSKMNVGMSATFTLPSSAAIINDAHAELPTELPTEVLVVAEQTMLAPPVAAVSFVPMLDKTLLDVHAVTAFLPPEGIAADTGKPSKLALSTPVVSQPILNKPAIQASDEAVTLVTPAAATSNAGALEGKADEKMQVQMPLSGPATTAMHVPKSSLSSPQREAKAMVNKRLSPEQQATHDYQQAIAYLQQGRVAEAQDALRNVLSVMPNHDDARQTLVGLLVDNHHKAEAMEVLQSGLLVSTAQPEFAHTLARLQLDAGQTTDALKTLQTTLPHAKQHAEYQALMAIVLQRLERHQEAIFHYQQALSLGARPPVWLIGLAVSLQTEGRAEEAKQAYQQAQHGDLTPDLAQFVDQRLKQVLQAN